MNNKPLSITAQLTVDVCKFILLQSKVHKRLSTDKALAGMLISERIGADPLPVEQILDELLVN